MGIAPEVEKLNRLYNISRSMHTLDLDTVLRLVLDGVTKSIGFDRARLYMIDEFGSSLRCTMAAGTEKDKIKGIVLPVSKKGSVVGRAVLEKRPYVIHNALRDPRVNAELKKRFNLKSLAVVPLIGREKVFGVITADNLSRNRKITKQQVETLITFATQAGLAIENASMYERLKKSSAELEEQLLRSGKLAALGQLTTGIAHELRNPLTSIKILIHAIFSSMPPRKGIREDMQVIDSEIERMDSIIKQFLDFSKPRELSLTRVSINGILKDTLKLMAYELKEQDIKVSENIDAELPNIQADSEQIKQVFLNIILNAAQAMPTGGRLIIKTERHRKYIRIRIGDTGSGIHKGIKNRLFDPFFTNREGGLGLGLCITKRIIDNHRGNIKIRNTKKAGAEAVIDIPAG